MRPSRPCSGSVTGCSMTSLRRGYLPTVPYISDCSSTMYCRPCSLHCSAQARPAGPAPTTTMSKVSAGAGPASLTRLATSSATTVPWPMAVRIRAQPVISPARKTPGVSVDSNLSVSAGMSSRAATSPSSTAIAPTGQSTAQRPWPTQRAPCTTIAWPLTMRSTPSSGQDSTHVPQPMQRAMSMLGYCRRALCVPNFLAFVRSAMNSVFCPRSARRRRRYTTARPRSIVRAMRMDQLKGPGGAYAGSRGVSGAGRGGPNYLFDSARANAGERGPRARLATPIARARAIPNSHMFRRAQAPVGSGRGLHGRPFQRP